MEYWKIKWQHSHIDEPYIIYSELDDDRMESRKIEIYQNDKIVFASNNEKAELLGEEPFPSIDTYNSLNDIETNWEEKLSAELISEFEFNNLWEKYASKLK